MAQLGNSLRVTFSNARLEQTSSLFGLPRRPKDEDIHLDWRAEVRYRSGVEWTQEVAAEGKITGAEVLWWAGWFAQAGRVRGFPTKLGDAPAEPVARLWTPLAGSQIEFFVWPEPLGGLVVMTLLTPDETAPQTRLSVEARLTDEDLEAFAQALETEYKAAVGNRQ